MPRNRDGSSKDRGNRNRSGRRRRGRERSSSGFSLVELMVALAIGSMLIVGAVTLYSSSQTTYRTNENIERVQEAGRYVLSVIQPDLELAGYYGFTNAADAVRFVQGGSAENVVAYANELRQYPAHSTDSLPVAVSDLPPGAHACGINYAVDVLAPVQGSEGQGTATAFGPGRGSSGCDAYAPGQQPNTDTLTIRRADTQTAAPQAGQIQLYASQLTSRTSQLLFADGQAPGPIDDNDQVRNLVVRLYYVAQSSESAAGTPALRMKSLTSQGGNVVFDDKELLPGVEDLQVQFGIDTGDYDNDGNVDPGLDPNGNGVPQTNGRATRYVNPDFVDLPRYQVVSVRVWVRVRATQPEVGYVDDKTYRYADIAYTPSGTDRNYRRTVVSRTVTLRNARTL